MMDYKQYLLLKLTEECAEVSQRALKQVQFGRDEIQTGQELTNEERLRSELIDLLGITKFLIEEGELVNQGPDTINPLIEKKRAKLQKYYAYSQSLGKVAS